MQRSTSTWPKILTQFHGGNCIIPVMLKSGKIYLPLVELTFIIPLSNGHVEHCFSQLTKINRRTSLGKDHLDHLLHIRIEGPHLSPGVLLQLYNFGRRKDQKGSLEITLDYEDRWTTPVNKLMRSSCGVLWTGRSGEKVSQVMTAWTISVKLKITKYLLQVQKLTFYDILTL